MATYSQLAYMANQEIARHNLATEKAAEANVKELHRSNLARENETHRSNVTQESLTAKRDFNNYVVNTRNSDTNAFNAQTNRMSQIEQGRHNRAVESVEGAKLSESIRHNKNAELNNYIGTGVNALTGISKEARGWARFATTGGLVSD